MLLRDVRRAGQFAGRVSVLVGLAKLQESYDAIDLGKGYTIGLLRGDGMTLLSRDIAEALARVIPAPA